MGYCCAGKGSKESILPGKLLAINLYREQFLGLSVSMSNPLIRSVGRGIKRARVEMGGQQKVRRPLTWGMLMGMQERVQTWGVGGRVFRVGLALSYCFCCKRRNSLRRG